ncbi:MAG: hypothetical protein C5B53_10585 [Candidatus Melainabacteria bacterium]|nr:MAG: hypothetical protein C5B53_10585 [Candidatus Melainabacteria bacterium]
MRIGFGFPVAVALLASLLAGQQISLAGGASRRTIVQGHVRAFHSHHQFTQPKPVQAVPTLNVRDFGAVGDGVTDDTNAIQNTFNAAQAAGKGVLFPAGIYLHTSTITANSIPLFGVGAASTLLANNPSSTALILTGVSPSIQNMVVSSVPASTGIIDITPTDSTLLVDAAQGFVVQNITIVQGTGRIGIYLHQSAVGNVSAVTLNGTGDPQDWGIFISGCANTSLLGNLLLNEGLSITTDTLNPTTSTSIAVIGNSINTNVNNNNTRGIIVGNGRVNDFYIAQNQIQLGGAGFALEAAAGDAITITQNVTDGGSFGIFFANTGNFNSITQNTIRNCSGPAIVVQSLGGAGNLPIIGNQFGECGLGGSGAVVSLNLHNGPDGTTVLNNVYAGHQNMLTFFVVSNIHINLFAGNTQTQTALANIIPP